VKEGSNVVEGGDGGSVCLRDGRHAQRQQELQDRGPSECLLTVRNTVAIRTTLILQPRRGRPVAMGSRETFLGEAGRSTCARTASPVADRAVASALVHGTGPTPRLLCECHADLKLTEIDEDGGARRGGAPRTDLRELQVAGEATALAPQGGDELEGAKGGSESPGKGRSRRRQCVDETCWIVVPDGEGDGRRVVARHAEATPPIASVGPGEASVAKGGNRRHLLLR
jgi:hypothetical protein